MGLLLNDDEVEALEAALSFVDEFAVDDELLDSPPPSPNLEQGNGDVADEELVGLSNSSGGDNAELTTEAMTKGTSSQAAISTNNSALLVVASKALVNGGDTTRRGSRAVDEAASGKTTPRRKQKHPNRARDERKNELAYLRNKVKQMEEQLQGLRQQNAAKDSGSATIATRSTVDPMAMPSVWRDMATTQQLLRENAERENARLKLVLESQIKLAKSMEVMMQRRTRRQLAGFSGLLGEAFVGAHGSTLDLLLDKDTYDELLARAEAAYLEVDAVLAANGHKDLKMPCTNAQMREGSQGTYVDIFINKMLPFNFNVVAEAVWSHLRGSDKHQGNLYDKLSKDLESSSDTVAEMFAMGLMANGMAADFRVNQVVRRYKEADRQVVVWVSTACPLENSKSPFTNFGFHEKGYVIINRVQGRDDFSLYQTCFLISPQIAGGGFFSLSRAGTFTEFVLSFMLATMTSSQQLIENVLMDQSLRHKQDPSSL